MKKRLMLLLLASTFAFSSFALSGCGDKDSKEEKESEDDKDKDDKDKDKDDKDNKDKNKKDKNKEDDDSKNDQSEDEEDDDIAEGADPRDSYAGGTFEAFLYDNGLYDSFIGMAGSDGTMELDVVNDTIYFSIYVDDYGLDDEQFEAKCEEFKDVADDIMDARIDAIFEEIEDDFGYSGELTLFVEVLGESNGRTVWTKEYTN